MKRMLALLIAVLLMGTAAYGQGGMGVAVEPGLEYQIFIPTVTEADALAKPVLQVPVSFVVPFSSDGQHNVRILGGPTVGQDYTGAGFGIGYAYAPSVSPNTMVGLVLKLGLTFPGDTTFVQEMVGTTSQEVWIDIGAEANFDFQAPVFNVPASLIVGASVGLRDTPTQVHVGLRVPMNPVGVSRRVHRL